MAYVYFIQAGNAAIKIGATKKDLDGRMRTLQTGNHLELTVIGSIEISLPPGQYPAHDEMRWESDFMTEERSEKRAVELEGKIHDLFHEEWIRGEWYQCSDELMAFIERHAKRQGAPSRKEREETVLDLLGDED